MGKKIAEFNRKIELAAKNMQLFCLEPSLESFTQICECKALRRSLDVIFETWRTSCLYKYGEQWGLQYDPENPGRSLDALQMVFDIQCEKMQTDAEFSPSKILAIKILHMFYAFGDVASLELYYQMLGHDKLPITTRKELADLYNITKEQYRTRVCELLDKDPQHIAKLGLDESVVDFSYIDRAVENARAAKAAAEEQRGLTRRRGY